MVSNSGVGSISGQAAAAEENRRSQARDAILDALGRLGIPYGEWPAFVRAHYRSRLSGPSIVNSASRDRFRVPHSTG